MDRGGAQGSAADDASAMETALASAARRRRHDIDALRILTCFSVIIGHALAVFTASLIYHVRSDDPSATATFLYEARHVWSMPTFFLVAGWSAMTALGRNGAGPFWFNRAKRLGIPLLLGLIFLMPVIKYFELKGGVSLQPNRIAEVDPISMSFWEFFPYYFTRSKLATWSHLWFLVYLLVITALTFPLLRKIAQRGSPGETPLRGYWAFMPILPLMAVLVIGHGWWPYYPNLIGDLPNFVYFSLFFLYGVALARHGGFEQAVERNRFGLALLGIAALVSMLFFVETLPGRLLAATAAWCIVTALYAYAKQIPFRPGRIFAYLKDAILPLFIVHNVFAVVIAWYVTQLPVPWYAGFTLILAGTLFATWLVYHFLIRPFALPRLLFGAPGRTVKR